MALLRITSPHAHGPMSTQRVMQNVLLATIPGIIVLTHFFGFGTLVNLAAGGGERNAVVFGHPSGTLRVGAAARERDGEWAVEKVIMSRSARVLMEGWVRIPANSF